MAAKNPVVEASESIRNVKGDFQTPKHQLLNKEDFHKKSNGAWARYGIDNKGDLLLVKEPDDKHYGTAVNVLVSWFTKLYHCQNGHHNDSTDPTLHKSLTNGDAYRLQLKRKNKEADAPSIKRVLEKNVWTIDNLASQHDFSEGKKILFAGAKYTSALEHLGGESLVDKALTLEHKDTFIPPHAVKEIAGYLDTGTTRYK